MSAPVDTSKTQRSFLGREAQGTRPTQWVPFSVLSFFQGLEKVLMTDLSGSQDQNKHYLNNLRLTALEDGQENYRLGK